MGTGPTIKALAGGRQIDRHIRIEAFNSALMLASIEFQAVGRWRTQLKKSSLKPIARVFRESALIIFCFAFADSVDVSYDCFSLSRR
jgi:hypothetical protein